MSDVENDLDSDHEVSKDHSKLLDAVSKLDKGQRVKQAQRSEPSLHVSEFHLVTTGAKSAPLPLSDLLRPLNSNPTHRPLTQKLKSLQTRSKVLPKPLERPQADALKRQVGFANTKKEIQKWDAIITRNRTAPNLSFPLAQGTISMKGTSTDEFLKRFRVKSDLEKELEALAPPKEAQATEDEFPLTLGEMLERRSEAARIRAQQSYREAKAHRLGKIKSKKFHRIARKAKIKQQMKEFEELKKTNPEAALEKLEQLDKTRAEERMSLRHRSTGQWAKNKQVRAKYDTESRKVLAQQLSISRDLTQKVRKGESDDESEEEPDDAWTKTTGEIEEFVKGYRQFWDEKNKEQMKKVEETSCKSSDKSETIQDGPNSVSEPNSGTNNKTPEAPGSPKKKSVQKKKVRELPRALNPVEEVYIDDDKIFDAENPGNTKKVSKDSKSKTDKNSMKSALDNDVIIEEEKLGGDRKSKKNGTKVGEEVSDANETSQENGFDVEEVEFEGRIIEVKKTDVKFTSDWSVEIFPTLRPQTSKDAPLDLDDLFDQAEEKLNRKISKKARRVKQKIRKLQKYSKVEENENSDEEVSTDLSFKNRRVRPEINEALDETSGREKNLSQNLNLGGKDIQNLNVVGREDQKTSELKRKAEIDPSKFIHVKPKHLRTQLPDDITGGDEAMDDSEGDDNQHDIISEAFADDDVVEEFRRDKEEEIKKSEPEDLDLRLPGWGSWGGKNLKQNLRKKRRFIIKFPKEAPRKDENKGDVIIVEDANTQIKQHLVAELPYPFTSVSDYEASIRAPIGRDFVPENAHQRLTDPVVKTKMGAIIEAMDEDVLLTKKKKELGGFPEKDSKARRNLAGKGKSDNSGSRKSGKKSGVKGMKGKQMTR